MVIKEEKEIKTEETEGKKKLQRRSKHIKGSKERLFIWTQTHTLQIFGVIPFVKLHKKEKLQKTK